LNDTDARAIIPTSDEGFLIVGFTHSFGSTGNGYLIKITMEEPEPEPEPEPEEKTETKGPVPGFPIWSIGLALLVFSLILQKENITKKF
jgi:hypothetical protein